MKFLLLAAAVFVPFLPLTAHDGDTLKGLVALRPGLYEEFTVRLDCYSAPELRKDGGGLVEAQRLQAWISRDGGYVLRTSWKTEKYGRLLGEPWRGDAGFCSTVGAP